MNKMFSILVPCRNEEKTIARLFNSIVQCGLQKDEYEVVFCDDGCTDNTVTIVKTYEDRINIIYCPTNVDIHCVSNSRQAGIPYATGEWITYIDGDDMFIPNALADIKDFILNTKVQYCLAADFYIYKDYVQERLNGSKSAFVMTHGKFYNKKNLIEKFNLSFQKDLLTDEDLVFNNQILSLHIDNKIDIMPCPIVTSYWVQRADSVTHKNNSSHLTRVDNNIDTFLYGYLGVMLDYIEKNPESIDNFRQVLMSRLIFIYAYSCVIPYRIKDDEQLNYNLQIIKSYKDKIFSFLNIDNEYLIQYVVPTYDFKGVYNDFKDVYMMYGVTNIISFQEWLYQIDFY